MDNIRGSMFMVLAMACFSIEDMFIKRVSDQVPAGEILLLFGIGGTLIFMLLTLQRREQLFPVAVISPPMLIRAISEIVGRTFFTLAIILTPLSSTSAILQATPLVVVIGAAFFFGEQVGWRRWIAVVVGFLGVLLVIRPGLDGFEASSLLAVLGMLGFAGRDLATRAAPAVLSNVQLGVYGFFILIPTGLGMLLYSGGAVWLSLSSGLLIVGATAFGIVAYYALTIAMRTGDISVVAPFRYTRLVFALFFGVIVFSESLDSIMLLGSSIIVASGAYTLFHQRRSVTSLNSP